MRKKIIRVLLIVIMLILIATVVVYFIFRKEREWLAFYMACGGGVLIVNLILSVIFVDKNFRDKGRP
ncbi:MAG: hypothetical protein LBH90_01265 [Tannerella sp.]|jgi:predicted permease|nr:hypothetical protein [Tannerella sp.]